MSMKHGLGSIGLWNIRRNSMSPTARSSSATSVATAESVASSRSPRARSNSSALSLSRVPSPVSVPTTSSSCFLSLPSSCARLGSFQMPGSSSALATAASRSALTAKSKIPPQIGSALLQPGEGVGDLVDLFRFHVSRIYYDWQTLYSAVSLPPYGDRVCMPSGIAYDKWAQCGPAAHAASPTALAEI